MKTPCCAITAAAENATSGGDALPLSIAFRRIGKGKLGGGGDARAVIIIQVGGEDPARDGRHGAVEGTAAPVQA